jgi:small-conductance mechanosensitive channel
MIGAVVPGTGLLDGTTEIFSLEIPFPPWVVLLALVAAGAAFHFGLRSALQDLSKRTATDLDDVLFEISGTVVPIAIVLAILYVATEMLDPVGHARLQSFTQKGVGIGAILLLFWTVTTLLLRSLSRWAARNPQFAPVYPPVRFVLKAVAVVVAAVTVLAFLNVNVAALAAALGVGGLAVALALKDTLENFFAGLHIMADRPVMEGDWVFVHETGDRGLVVKIGWRSTRIRTADNNFLVLPNVKLASGAVTNMTARDPHVHVRVQVGVDYESDPDRVIALLEEEARAGVGTIPGLLADPAPQARLHPGFGPSSLDFTLRATVQSMEYLWDAEDLLRRRILKRLRAEKIGIPFPVTTIRVEKPADR